MTQNNTPAPESLIAELTQLVGQDKVLLNEPMSRHTTFQIGGPVDAMVLPGTEEQAAAVIRACAAAGVTPWLIGLGSNLLVSDDGLRGVAVKLAQNLADVQVDGDRLICQAGASNEQVAAIALEHGLAGYEFASGIPGTIGGAAIMNAGAYDGDFSTVAESVRCVTPAGELVEVSAADAAWSYRHSMMMDAGYLVVGATLRLTPDDPAAIKARMDDLRERRESKQPLEMPSAGSTFKRPEGYFAGKLIQDSGCQGLSVGGAQVSTKHAGFVVNTGGATAADVLGLIKAVQERVMEHDGVAMEPEVRMWGF
ncbi:MAG: UDP-N-acetylmuramate dehydrogenase [Coriobacteriia bacterium]|nr:UDP-N-acetylmuramate dehydrogenase [Coriobacteriia bacterium]